MRLSLCKSILCKAANALNKYELEESWKSTRSATPRDPCYSLIKLFNGNLSEILDICTYELALWSSIQTRGSGALYIIFSVLIYCGPEMNIIHRFKLLLLTSFYSCLVVDICVLYCSGFEAPYMGCGVRISLTCQHLSNQNPQSVYYTVDISYSIRDIRRNFLL